jgi:hypothetical protein
MKYCPKCRIKYGDWVKLCADCEVRLEDDLVSEPPQEMPGMSADYVRILTIKSLSDIDLIKTLLDANDIKHYIKNEDVSDLEYSQQELMVIEDRAEEAKELLRDFTKGSQSDEP